MGLRLRGKNNVIKAIPHKDCRLITSVNFSSDCTKSTNKAGAYEEILGKNDGKFTSKQATKPSGGLCAVLPKYAARVLPIRSTQKTRSKAAQDKNSVI